MVAPSGMSRATWRAALRATSSGLVWLKVISGWVCSTMQSRRFTGM